MKKNVLLAAVALCSGASVAGTAPFNGFYAGVESGYTWRKETFGVNLDLQVTGSAVQNKILEGSSSKGKSGPLFGAYAGYGKTLNGKDGFYLGLEAYGYHDGASKIIDHEYSGTNEALALNMSAKLSVKCTRGFVLGVAPRVGVVVGDNLFYARFGVERSNDRFSGSTTTTYTQGANPPVTDVTSGDSKGKSKLSFVPGVGYERAFGKIIVRAEYNHSFGTKRSEKIDRAIPAGLITGSKSHRYHSDSFKVGVAFQF